MTRGATVSAIGEEEDENGASGAEEGDEGADRPDADTSSLRTMSVTGVSVGPSSSLLLGRAPSVASIPGGPLRHEDLLKRLFDTGRAYRDYKRLGFEFRPPLHDYLTHSPHCAPATEHLRLAIGNAYYALCRRYCTVRVAGFVRTRTRILLVV